MYYQIDKEGFYLGIQRDSNEGMEFFTEVTPIGLFNRHKWNGSEWIEGGEANTEPIKEEPPQDVLDFIETLKQKYNL